MTTPYIPSGKRVDYLERRITNVIASLNKWVSAPRQPGRAQNIQDTAQQLDELWSEYLDYMTPIENESDITDDDLPF